MAAPEDGVCRASGSAAFPVVQLLPVPGNPTGDDLRDYCKNWCALVEPEKVVGVGTKDTAPITCNCYYSFVDKPTGFGNTADFKANYSPNATSVADLGGVGCVVSITAAAGYKCFRNCAYKQCVSMCVSSP